MLEHRNVNLSWVTVSVGVVFVLAGQGGSNGIRLMADGTATPNSACKDTKIFKAQALANKFRANPIRARINFLDATLFVTGRIVEIRPRGASGASVTIFAHGTSTKCLFADRSKVIQLSLHNEVMVAGVCMGKVGENIQLADCVLHNEFYP